MAARLNESETEYAYSILYYVNNDQALYKQFMAFNQNYILKKKKGNFDKKLAKKGLLNVVRAAITKMNKSRFDKLPRLRKEVKEKAADLLFNELWYEFGLRYVKKARKPTKKGGFKKGKKA